MEKERGFTLIELLVVLAILATLFGVTALALGGITNNAERDLATTERDTILTALDVCDVQSGCTNATTSTTCEEVGQGSGGGSGFGQYLRRSSHFFYHWDDNGVITQNTEAGCTGTQYYPVP